MAVEDLPPETEDEANATPPKPVPDLPEVGDLAYHPPEPVVGELRRGEESDEAMDEPNDLSGIDKEFDD